jgi:hypothetical protein
MASVRVNISDRLPLELRIPTITVWNRLEPRPRTTDFSRSLRVEVRDALWMLTRQWQFGEFKGNDAGSAISAKVQIETAPITHYAQRNQPAEPYDPTLPLEMRVEREPITLDLMTSLQMGQHWLRLLRHYVSDDRYADLYRAAYPITVPPMNTANADVFSNRDAWQVRAAAAGRGLDGGSLYTDLLAGEQAENMTADGLFVAGIDKPQVAQAAIDFLATYSRMFNQPTTDTAWVPEQLEYQFACAAPDTVLLADEYYQGHLDWYSFDIDPTRQQLDETPSPDVIQSETLTFIPSQIRFAGMPNRRWWEFEDGRTNFGNIKADKTDIAQLLLAEFGLIYGNDWLVTPYVVPVGSLCAIQGLAVKDVFGQRTLIQPAGRGEDEDWQRWAMFNLSVRGDTGQADTRLFLPPAVTKLLESPPVEEVTFIRDEMANMVWAIESTLPNDLLGGMNGYEAALALVDLLKQLTPPLPPGPALLETDALIRFVLATSVPENWIPFIPVHVEGSNREIQLQRAQMLRTLFDPPTPIEPRGVLLRYGLPSESYFVHEEEVPRAGAIITRGYQRVRWSNGETYLWLGRRKSTGRGEGSSGLQFDQIRPNTST